MSAVRVLLGEDDPVVRRAVADLIDGEDGLELTGTAADADEAIRMALDQRPDVAVLDVKMPLGGGPRAAREILARSPHTRVVALSAYGDRRTLLEMLRSGAISYVVKGGRGEELIRSIHLAARGQTWLSPEVQGTLVRAVAELIDGSDGPAGERVTR